MIFIGAVFLTVSIGTNISRKKRLQRCSSLAKAIIVDVRGESYTLGAEDLPKYSWYPVYEYSINGQTIRKVSRIEHAKQDFNINQVTELYYNPKTPNEFYVSEEGEGKAILIFKMMGYAFLVIGLIAFAAIKVLK